MTDVAAPTTGAPRPVLPIRQRIELAGLWCVVIMLVLFGAGFVIGYLPPPRPGADAATMAEFYGDSPERRRIGALGFIAGAMFFLPFAATVSAQMRRVPGLGRVLADTQFAAAIVLAVMTNICGFVMLIAAFRDGRSDDLVLLLNDIAWMPFVGAVMPVIAEVLALAIAIFFDRGPRPVFPRWLAWFCVWVAAMELTGLFVGFFDHGPFAWNGVLAFYVAAAAFFAWYVAVFWVVRRNLLAQGREAASEPTWATGRGE